MRIDVTLRDPSGTDRDVAVVGGPDATWGQAAGALAPHAAALWWRGRPVPGGARLGEAGPADGAVLLLDPPGDPVTPPPGYRLDVVGGPDAGHGVPLGSDPVIVGRGADCRLRLTDPRVSRCHLRVAVGPRGVTVEDLGSAAGTYIERHAVGNAPAALALGSYLRIGDSYLRVAHLAPAPEPAPVDTLLALPDPPAAGRAGSARVPWAAALVPAAAGAGLAVVTHSMQFLLFAVLSPLALLGSSLTERARHRRPLRRARREYRLARAQALERAAAALRREVDRRRAAQPDPATVAAMAAEAGSRLWVRSRDGPDLLTVRLGLGDRPSTLQLRDGDRCRPAGIAAGVPVCVDLASGPVELAGPPAVTGGVARWLLAQLGTQAGPDVVEVRLVLASETQARWRWARWLPHLGRAPYVGAEQHAELVAELTALRAARTNRAGAQRWAGPWLVLVIDAGSAATVPGLGEVLRDGSGLGVTAIVLDTRRGTLTGGCGAAVRAVGETGTRLELRGPGPTVSAVADQVDTTWSERLARALASRRPVRGPSGQVPRHCSLETALGLRAVNPHEVLARWRRSDGSLRTPLGRSGDGAVLLDLVRDGPHALVAGTTGSGKSELLRSVVAGIAASHPPDRVGFVLIDYKGGAAFADCARLPHTLGVVTDLDAQLAARALESLECELRRREALFAAAGASDLAGYLRSADRQPVARLVIVVDEFAELAAELAEFVSGLVAIARRGRSLGVHLVLATQRPAGVVSGEIRANTAVRVALRVTDPGDSQDVIGVPDAAAIGQGNPGRLYLRLPGCDAVPVQAAIATGEVEAGGAGGVRVVPLDDWRRPVTAAAGTPGTGLGRLVDAAAAAARLGGHVPPPSPWRPPLPECLPVAAIERDSCAERVPIGLVDLPARQAQQPLTVDLGRGGSLLLAGAARSGRTCALLTLAGAAADRLSTQQLHLYGIDHAGGGLRPLAGLPHCGAVIVDDAVASGRLLTRLAVEVQRRRAAADGPAPPALLLLLDGWEQFLTAAEQHAPGPVEQLIELLRTGPSARLTVAVTGDRGALAARLASAIDTKLALRLTDRADYALLAIPDRAVPHEQAPGRALRAADAAQVQLAHLGARPTAEQHRDALAHSAARWPRPAAGSRPFVVRPLPTTVRLADLPARAPGGAGTAEVVLGVGGDAAEPIGVDLLAARARLLVAGPPGSGRSTLLCSLLTQLATVHRAVLAVAPPGSPLPAAAHALGVRLLSPDDAAPASEPEPSTVVLIDDCETLLDRPLGEAAARWAHARPDIAVVAAGAAAELAVTFRGVGALVRAARCAVLLQPGPGDGELVGVRLGRGHSAGPPGRGLLVGDRARGGPPGRDPLPLQVATPSLGPDDHPMCG